MALSAAETMDADVEISSPVKTTAAYSSFCFFAAAEMDASKL